MVKCLKNLILISAVLVLPFFAVLPVQAQTQTPQRDAPIQRVIIEESAPNAPVSVEKRGVRKGVYAVMAIGLLAVAGYFIKRLWAEDATKPQS